MLRPFFFLRHGQTNWNVDKIWQGQTDVPLNATGVQQAHYAAEKLRMQNVPITRIVSSPLIRAYRTAEIVAKSLNITVDVDTRLKERAYGAFEGLSSQKTREKYGLAEDESHEHILPPDAETLPALTERIKESLLFWFLSYPHDTILIVSHGGCCSALQADLCGQGGYNRVPTGAPHYFQPAKGSYLWTFKPV
ncbi:MAG: histidine phosphatase family protein [Blastochloris viridis]|uniref:Histidine phosphatase family protein n=1 Tax=Blastochloris viridis TaxID=1079 RepID=A0A6N4RAZ3_BLAVI|nr:MAG: histidine phosphatase family protein [Blastochloris viridis]